MIFYDIDMYTTLYPVNSIQVLVPYDKDTHTYTPVAAGWYVNKEQWLNDNYKTTMTATEISHSARQR